MQNHEVKEEHRRDAGETPVLQPDAEAAALDSVFLAARQTDARGVREMALEKYDNSFRTPFALAQALERTMTETQPVALSAERIGSCSTLGVVAGGESIYGRENVTIRFETHRPSLVLPRWAIAEITETRTASFTDDFAGIRVPQRLT